jgi:lysozyme family protein
MKSNFNDCLTRLLKDEGGYSNTPGDNGGPTNFGITIADYRKYINKKGTATDVKNMSVDQASTIYRQKYWDSLGCDDLPSGVDYSVFDYGVNSGLGRPRAVLKKYSNLSGVSLINAINDERTIFLKAIGVGHNAKFLKGWLARVNRVRSYSLQLSKQTPTVPKAVGGVLAGLIAGVSSTYHWGLAHWQECLGGAVLAAILIYSIIHLLHRKTNG